MTTKTLKLLFNAIVSNDIGLYEYLYRPIPSETIAVITVEAAIAESKNHLSKYAAGKWSDISELILAINYYEN